MSETIQTISEIQTIEDFLAHALTLETEAANGYEEIGDAMDVHNNPETAKLFHRFARYGRKHAAEVEELAAGVTLPQIAPWDFVWKDAESPEAPSVANVHYKMTPLQALELAMRAERQAHAFYSTVAEKTTNADVRKLALEFAEEEAEHVRILTEWMKAHPEPEKDWDYDPDPPSMPE